MTVPPVSTPRATRIFSEPARRRVTLRPHPNGAVAEDKRDGYRFAYTSGAIENPAINRAIIDVLEGTRPAFDNRDAKYLPVPLPFGAVTAAAVLA